MKLELDFSDQGALKATKRELEAALASINKALEIFESTLSAPANAESPRNSDAPPDGTIAISRPPKGGLIVELPDEFSTKDSIDLGRKYFMKSGRVRRLLASYVMSKKVEIVHQGHGRSPTIYRKMK